MKYSIFFLLILISCKPDADLNDPESLDWMLGSWERVDDQPNQQTYEIWKKDGDNYTGFGYTLQEKDTVFKEEMKLSKSGQWILTVSGVNEEPVAFISRELQAGKLSIFNPMHDFPKEIHYWIQNDTLKASVGNEGEQIEFSFIK